MLNIMKYYISYFYQLRFFPINAIPLSTCMWDPKWYHAFQGKDHTFVDDRGIINGLRIEDLVPAKVHEIGAEICSKDCGQEIPCKFMTAYYDYLTTLDFNKLVENCEKLVYNNYKSSKEPFIILLVNEPPYVKCAERPCLIKWFNEHDIELTEWDKNSERNAMYEDIYKGIFD